MEQFRELGRWGGRCFKACEAALSDAAVRTELGVLVSEGSSGWGWREVGLVAVLCLTAFLLGGAAAAAFLARRRDRSRPVPSLPPPVPSLPRLPSVESASTQPSTGPASVVESLASSQPPRGPLPLRLQSPPLHRHPAFLVSTSD